jgi:hypothetical protein
MIQTLEKERQPLHQPRPFPGQKGLGPTQSAAVAEG